MYEQDSNIIEAIGNGDPLAFECFVRLYQNRVLNFFYRYLGDRYAAEDLTQELFLRVYRNASGFQPRSSVSSWVFTIAYNLAMNEIKRSKRCVSSNVEVERLGAEGGGMCDPLEAKEMGEEIAVALARLPESQRAALLLKAVEGLSYLEISCVLGVSVSSVESLIFRARRKLRQDFDHSNGR